MDLLAIGAVCLVVAVVGFYFSEKERREARAKDKGRHTSVLE